MSLLRVRCQSPGGRPLAVDTGAGWVDVVRVADRWQVEVGWWRTAPARPVRRSCWRVLLGDGACLDLRWELPARRWRLERSWG
ncbi:MAG: hypothetical protein ACRENV_03190 [Candidatus Dormibacteria bacterium]